MRQRRGRSTISSPGPPGEESGVSVSNWASRGALLEQECVRGSGGCWPPTVRGASSCWATWCPGCRGAGGREARRPAEVLKSALKAKPGPEYHGADPVGCSWRRCRVYLRPTGKRTARLPGARTATASRSTRHRRRTWSSKWRADQGEVLKLERVGLTDNFFRGAGRRPRSSPCRW